MRIQRRTHPRMSDEMTGYSANNRTLDAATRSGVRWNRESMAANAHITGITNLLFMSPPCVLLINGRSRSWFTATL
jgi:hypothetical protein